MDEMPIRTHPTKKGGMKITSYEMRKWKRLNSEKTNVVIQSEKDSQIKVEGDFLVYENNKLKEENPKYNI